MLSRTARKRAFVCHASIYSPFSASKASTAFQKSTASPIRTKAPSEYSKVRRASSSMSSLAYPLANSPSAGRISRSMTSFMVVYFIVLPFSFVGGAEAPLGFFALFEKALLLVGADVNELTVHACSHIVGGDCSCERLAVAGFKRLLGCSDYASLGVRLAHELGGVLGALGDDGGEELHGLDPFRFRDCPLPSLWLYYTMSESGHKPQSGIF
nr:MAG TPA: hypothetical protein [Caudoviricetes sp.]